MDPIFILREDDVYTEWYCELCGWHIQYNRITRRYVKLYAGDVTAGHGGMDFAEVVKGTEHGKA